MEEKDVLAVLFLQEGVRAAEITTAPFWLSTVICPATSSIEADAKLVLADTSPLILAACTGPFEFSTVRLPAMRCTSTAPKLVLAKVSPSTLVRWIRPLPVVTRAPLCKALASIDPNELFNFA